MTRSLAFLLLLALAPGIVSAQQSRWVRETIVPYPPEREPEQAFAIAHPTFPVGTVVRMQERQGGPIVTARVADHGFVMRRRDIMASQDVFDRLGARDRARVRLWKATEGESVEEQQGITDAQDRDAPIDAPAVEASPMVFSVQLGSFREETAARQFSSDIPQSWLREDLVDGRTVHRVFFGAFEERDDAEAWEERLRRQGLPGLVRQVAPPGIR